MKGPNRKAELEAPIPPVDEVWMRVVLRDGTYYVYCPVENHEARGMERQFVVRSAEPADMP